MEAADLPPKPLPSLTPRAEAERAARAGREAAALRTNLLRRKAQARARREGAATPESTE